MKLKNAERSRTKIELMSSPRMPERKLWTWIFVSCMGIFFLFAAYLSWFMEHNLLDVIRILGLFFGMVGPFVVINQSDKTYGGRSFYKSLVKKKANALVWRLELLAEHQPSMPLPEAQETIKVSWFEKRRQNGKILLFVWLTMQLALLVFAFPKQAPWFYQTLEWYRWFWLLVPGITLAFAIFFFLKQKPTEAWLRLTPVGLSSSEANVNGMEYVPDGVMLWEDAALFATYTEPRLWSAPVRYYELVGPTASLVWRSVEPREADRFQFPDGYEAYEQQLKLVHAFIAAKTGLPLFDLDKPL